MSERNFMTLLNAQFAKGKFVCVGLDPTLEKIPERFHNDCGSIQSTILNFNKYIIDETKDIAALYKPNAGFYEEHGISGLLALEQSIEYANEIAPEVPVGLDVKRGDIGNTNLGYVTAAFDKFGADAATVSPYLGGESLLPFLERKEKGIIVLCRTSNPGAGEFQDLEIVTPRNASREYVYQRVAKNVATNWNTNGNCLLVVGATNPKELAEVRKIVGDMTILIPGIGKQGGDLQASVVSGMNSKGVGFAINSSRGIIFTDSPGEEALKLHENITHFRQMELVRRNH